MECSKVLGFLVFLCLTIPMISSSSDSLFSASPKSRSDENVRIRVNMTRRSERGLSFSERLSLAVNRSKGRMKMMEAFVKQQIRGDGKLNAETPVHWENGEFLMSVAVGTPSVSFEAIVDTGSDLIWTQCEPCEDCFSQPTPIFDPSKSSTFLTIPCGDSLCDALGDFQTGCNPDCTFMYLYGSGSTSGDLAYETLSIGSSKIKGIGFGCGHDNKEQGSSHGGGIVGLGRGDLSLISQLGSTADNIFSYCLLSITDNSSQTSPLIFGEGASFSGAKTIQLIQGINTAFWYIPITGITLNGKAVEIPPGTFDLQPDGSGGMFIDSGTTFTILDEAAYTPLKEAIQSAIHLKPVDGSSTSLDLCYNTSSPSAQITLPTLVFNFKGAIEYELPPDNFFVQASESLLCLAMWGQPLDKAPSTFGNIQQQNFHILFNNAENTLSFKPTKCDSL